MKWSELLIASMHATLPMRGNTGPSGLRVPSSAALSRWNSIGSIPIVSHSSETSDSLANVACGVPGARYAAVLDMLMTTS